MQAPVLWISRKIVEFGGKIVLQVVVSVAATVCVASITNVYLKGEPATGAASPPAMAEPGPRTVASLALADYAAGASLTRVAGPSAFASVFGPGEKGAAATAGADGPVAIARAEARTAPSRPRPGGVSGCSDACDRLPASAILPPERPAGAGASQVAEAPVPAEGGGGEKRLHLLGLPLPRFVPSGERIVTTMASLGGSISDFVLK